MKRAKCKGSSQCARTRDIEMNRGSAEHGWDRSEAASRLASKHQQQASKRIRFGLAEHGFDVLGLRLCTRQTVVSKISQSMSHVPRTHGVELGQKSAAQADAGNSQPQTVPGKQYRIAPQTAMSTDLLSLFARRGRFLIVRRHQRSERSRELLRVHLIS
jgi:hypothetical protein